MKTHLFFWCFFIGMLISLECMAQNLEKYSGTYDHGVAEYTYYNNQDGTRTMHGSFSAHKDLAPEAFRYQYGYDITGSYNNGKRHGEWMISFECVPGQFKYIPYSGHYVLNYENGRHVGKQVYVCESTNPGDRICFRHSVEFSCHNNKIDGEFNCKIDDIVYHGRFNNGMAVGRWEINEPDFKHIYDIDKHVFYSLDLETGDKINIDDFPRWKYLDELIERYIMFFESLLDPGNDGVFGASCKTPKNYTPVEYVLK